MKGYTCRICGQYHEELPLSYGSPAPAYWYGIPEFERNKRALLSSDQCEIDNQYFFIVGNIDIPIIGTEQVFSWSVWISLSDSSYKRVSELWNTVGREKEPPYFGWLSTSLPIYPDTINLKTMLHTRPVGERPYIELEPTDHPLAIEQRNGISWERVQEIAELVLHSR
ncbi:MAG: DUF2199 domain-containing protein [Chloroflexi bacterium]|nr:DUF2199 domain-containing protein [Chloroflexota bacterium]MDL1943886.1 DUF2199 domain-containing protein [Chloroflexi bacterium CFX2]